MIYKVWCEDYHTEEEAKIYNVFVLGPADVAEVYAKEMDNDSSDYSFVNGNGELVINVKDENGVVTKWKVTGDWDPIYYAEEIK